MINRDIAKVDKVDAYLRRERANNVGLADRSRVDQDASERSTVLGLFLQCRVEIGLGDEVVVEQERAKRGRLGQGEPPRVTSSIGRCQQVSAREATAISRA